ncbi:MAG: Rrf2 family transcriptional regulator [Pirellulaceae bacterium]|nr:Rrf2 family transcriptional regulator [Pirellulaceae bacterium]
MISQTAEYALRAIVYLADQRGSPRTTAQIAEATQVPPGYLAKVMQSLSRTKLVHSQRGLNGGFTLTRHECPLGLPTHHADLCPLHRNLEEAAALLEQKFSSTSVADLLNVPGDKKPLCHFPSARPEAPGAEAAEVP